MEKVFAIFVLLFCGIILHAQESFVVNDPNGQSLKYIVTGDGQVAVGKNEWSGDCSIPVTVVHDGHTYTVTSIGELAFYDCKNLTSVTIPNTVITIGDLAFEGCKGLISVTLPNSVTTIGHGAFSNCSNLTSINIPNSVKTIGNGAFQGSKLSFISIPASVVSIGKGAFWWCIGLSSIVVAKDNPVYDSRENCNAIIRSTSNTLMAGCRNSHIPNTVTAIGDGAFEGCEGLISIDIPYSVTMIGEDAFMGCTHLTAIDIPRFVTTIGNGAFYKCSSLTSVIIPNEVILIGKYAFAECENLTDVSIPYSVEIIGDNAFQGCSNLRSIGIAKDHPFYKIRKKGGQLQIVGKIEGRPEIESYREKGKCDIGTDDPRLW